MTTKIIRKNYTEEEIDFIKVNYSNNGSKYCAEFLGVTPSRVKGIANKLDLKLSKERKSITQSLNSAKINYCSLDNFIKIDNPNIIYLMGLIWADGYLHKTKSRLELYMVYDDFICIEECLNKIGEWRYRLRIREGKKPSVTISCFNKEICNLFREYGFSNKSKFNPKFLDKIPNELIHHFFRGVIDGDGCFYYRKSVNNKGKDIFCRQFTLAGSYEQEWGYFTNFLEGNSIKYYIKQKTQKNGTQKFSYIYVGGAEIIKLGKIIYNNHFPNYIRRKYTKYWLIEDSYDKNLF